MLCALLVLSIALTACGTPPPPVSKSQFETAGQEAMEAEANVARLQSEKSQLEAQLAAETAKRDALQEMADEKK